MKSRALRGPLVAAAFAGVVYCSALLAETPAASPWSKVPPLTTACYYGTDPFVAKLDAAIAAVNAARSKQLAINKRIEDEYKSIDPMEMASRMQQWMMSNPQEAMAYMQGVQAVGEDFNARMPEMNAATMRFESEQKDLAKRYQVALQQAYAPGHARFVALKKKLGVPLEYPSVKDPGTPDWAMAEENAIMRDLDRAYVAFCPSWWSATGPARAWLKTYRDWITKDFIPFGERLGSQNAQTYAIMSTPSASYRTVSAEDGVLKYLEAVSRAFALRREKPICTATDCGYQY